MAEQRARVDQPELSWTGMPSSRVGVVGRAAHEGGEGAERGVRLDELEAVDEVDVADHSSTPRGEWRRRSQASRMSRRE